MQRLGDLLRAYDGIEASHVSDSYGQASGQICIHYDPIQLSISVVRELARRAGAELEMRFGHLLLKTDPMHERQARMVESRAKQIAGVLEAGASPTGVLRIEFDRQASDEAAIRAAIQKIGMRILETPKKRVPADLPEAERKPSGKEHLHTSSGQFGERTELIFAALCGGFYSLAGCCHC